MYKTKLEKGVRLQPIERACTRMASTVSGKNKPGFGYRRE
jgi:hypothetical protein